MNSKDKLQRTASLVSSSEGCGDGGGIGLDMIF